jgi:zinc/manganese transport system substrate-binding protein
VPRARAAVAALATLTAVGLSGCAAQAGAGPATSTGDPGACPADLLDVVVSVGQWSDLTRSLAGACADVTTVVGSAAVDPHDFEPTTGDLARFENADLVVVNGAGYDHWAESAVAGLDPAPVVVDAAAVSGARTRTGDAANPHLWYSPQDVDAMAAAVTAALADLAPAAAGYFGDRAAEWTAALAPYRREISVLQASAAGHTYAATETVFDPMAAAIGLTDVTPERYRAAASNGSDPAPGAVAAFEEALRSGAADVLVVNTQTEGSIPAQLRRAAADAGVPVVEVTESVPAGAGSFLAWQLDQLRQLSDVLGGVG